MMMMRSSMLSAPLLLLAANTWLASGTHVLLVGGADNTELSDILQRLLRSEDDDQMKSYAAHLNKVPRVSDYPSDDTMLYDVTFDSRYNESLAGSWDYDFVALQEQAEVPGFYPPEENHREVEWEESRDSILTLHQQAQDRGVTTILVESPAYFNGDPKSAMAGDMYPSFEVMQEHITHGYELYYKEIIKKEATNSKANVKIAPCGQAFQRIHDEAAHPLQEGLIFERLYLPGKEPRKQLSTLGNYLCASVLFYTIHPDAPSWSIFYVPKGMDELEQKVLATAAYKTVQEIGTVPKPASKTYRSKEHQQRRSRGPGIFNFIFAFLLGGGIIYGWIVWKWNGAAETINGMEYQLLPQPSPEGSTTSGGLGGRLMEMMDMPSAFDPKEPQWINPV